MSRRNLVEVYRAKDSLQAHALRAELNEVGIEAVVEGDQLQQALGELPPGWATAPRLLVAASDWKRARELIMHLEQSGEEQP